MAYQKALIKKNKNWLKIFFQLLQKKGFEEKNVFVINMVGEGNESPAGIEAKSGHFITKEGKIFSFWFEWDKKKKKHSIGADNFFFDKGKKTYYFKEQPMFSKSYFTSLGYLSGANLLKKFLKKEIFEKIKKKSKTISPGFFDYCFGK